MAKRLRGSVLAAVLLPGLGAPQSRVAVDGDAWPWSAIVRVQIAGVSRCTGFLTDARTVVTAAHCLFSHQVRHLLWPGAIHVLAGYRNGAFAAHAIPTSYQVGPGYDPLHEGQSLGEDVAVLHLPEPLPLPGGARGLALRPALPGTAAMLGGYERDRAEIILADRDCRVMGSLSDGGGHMLRQHSCAATLGTSGAPVLVPDSAAGWAAAGVAVAATNPHQAGGLAVPAATVSALLSSK